jgi:hypothetical protein
MGEPFKLFLVTLAGKRELGIGDPEQWPGPAFSDRSLLGRINDAELDRRLASDESDDSILAWLNALLAQAA